MSLCRFCWKKPQLWKEAASACSGESKEAEYLLNESDSDSPIYNVNVRIGAQIIRGEERIDIAPLPDVFTHIAAEEYALLAPLSARAFVVEDMRTQTYLNPAKYINAFQEVWDSYSVTTNVNDARRAVLTSPASPHPRPAECCSSA